MQKISEDVEQKRYGTAMETFLLSCQKISENRQFSAMYIKFVFSNVIQELFVENRFGGET